MTLHWIERNFVWKMRWPLARIDSDNSHVEVELYQNIDYFENSIHSSAYYVWIWEAIWWIIISWKFKWNVSCCVCVCICVMHVSVGFSRLANNANVSSIALIKRILFDFVFFKTISHLSWSHHAHTQLQIHIWFENPFGSLKPSIIFYAMFHDA